MSDLKDMHQLILQHVTTCKECRLAAAGVAPVVRRVDDLDSLIEQQAVALQEALKEFREFRASSKRPLTVLALTKAIKQLERYHPDDIDARVLSIEQTIANGWTGLFEYKGTTASKKYA